MTTASPTTNHEPRTTNNLLRSDWFILLLAAAYFLALAPFTPGFASAGNVTALLTTLLPLLLLAVGQTFVLVTGGIDLSVTATVAVASVVGGLALNLDTGWLGPSAAATPLGIALMLAAGAAIGLVNGAAVAVFRMPAFIVTLTTMMFGGGLAVWLTQSKGIANLPAGFVALGGRTLPALALTALAVLAAHLLLARTLFGRWLYAVGHNARAAHVSGVPVAGVTVAAYVASGVLAALAAVLLTGQAETASPVLGQRMLLDVVAATVIGGVSLFGGRGRVLGALFGVLFIRLLDNSLTLLDLDYFVIQMVKGAVILLAALLDVGRSSWFVVRGS